MSLPPALVDREQAKFCETPANEVAVRICGELNASIHGATGPFLVTTKTIPDTATLAVASPLANRQSMSIRNLETTNILYVGPSALVTADSVTGTTSGWEVGPNEDFHIDIDSTQVLYLIAETGKTVQVKILEIASA